ncbi:MAG: transcriptional regulator [Caldilinea sp.]|jgi:AraC family transcriptional regulator of arabinose operon|nr:MAG: transcriptional regulator [Caldilinea sp.]
MEYLLILQTALDLGFTRKVNHIMDESRIPESPIRIREGFRGQVQHVLPRPLLNRVAGHPLLQSLLPTDIGWYPTAQYHYRERPEGAGEHILIYCAAGAGWAEIRGEFFAVHSGEAIVIPANTPHCYGASNDDPWSIHWVHFLGSTGEYLAHLVTPSSYKLSVDARCGTTIESLFRTCYELFPGGFVLSRLIYCAQVLHHLLGELFFNNPAFSPAMRSSRFHSIESTLAFLRQNLHRSLSLSEMADHAGLSESHFSRIFKEQTGHSPLDYFILLKMQHASTLLSITSLSVKEVAAAVGYADPYYFSRLFKKTLGISPRTYRNTPKG